jgi:hypothetical protein
MKRLASILLAVTLSSSLDQAKASFDGGWLLKQCEAVERHNRRKAKKEDFENEAAAIEELSKYSSCTAYIAGALDTRFIHCFPRDKEIQIGELAVVVVSWLRAHPKRLRENGSVLVLDAIDDTYRCEGR